MRNDDLEKRKRAVENRFGTWTAHSVALGADVYTFQPWVDTRLRRVLQTVSDLAGAPLDRLRILDLACLEGQLGIEFALHGSQVVAIEGREVNLAKARFAKEELSLENLHLVHGDVRDFDVERFGRFDVILCAGILYHLDAPGVMDFLEKITSACEKILVVDTHVSLTPQTSRTWRGRSYWGSVGHEHADNASNDEKAASVWKSLDNTNSFRFTLQSLANILRHLGYTTVLECMNPFEYYSRKWPQPAGDGEHIVMRDRVMLVALKGQRQKIISSPITDSEEEIDRPEYITCAGHEELDRAGRALNVRQVAAKIVPKPIRRLLSKLIDTRDDPNTADPWPEPKRPPPRSE